MTFRVAAPLLLASVMTLAPAQAQDLDRLLNEKRDLPDFSVNPQTGEVLDKAALQKRRDEMVRQFTEGQCSPAVAHVGGNVTIICHSVAKAEENGTLVVERVTKLIPKDESDPTASFDIILSNMRTADAWVKKITIAGLGSSNGGCNPNPIATFRYRIDLSQGRETRAVVSAPDAKEGLPAQAKVGTLQHSYCDGYLVVSYDQSVRLPKREKISYVLEIGEIEFQLLDASVSGGYYWGTKEQVSKDDFVIPRLGLTLDGVKAIGGIARGLTPHSLLEDRGPSYAAPIWSNWFVFIHLDDGSIIAGKTGFGKSSSDLSERAEGEENLTPLYSDLEQAGIPAAVASRLFGTYWVRK